MRIGLISDLHLGIHDNDEEYFEYYQDIFDYFSEVCLEEEINFVVCLGDVMHHRKKVGTNTISFVNKIFGELQKKLKIYIIAGNHDFRFKNSPSVCSFTELKFSDFPNVFPIVVPTIKKFDDKKCLFLPWPKVFPQDKIQKLMETKYDYVFGHFSVMDFYQTVHHKDSTGFLPTEISNLAKQVFLGHFHIPQEYRNICYVGTPIHLNRNDFNQKKRFIIFDTDTEEIKEFPTNHLFPNHLKIYSIDELKNYYIPNSKLEFYLPSDTVEKISAEQYQKLNILLRRAGAKEIKIKIFDKKNGKEFDDFEKSEDQLILSIKEIMTQLMVEESQIREVDHISTEELKNYVDVLYNKAENFSSMDKIN